MAVPVASVHVSMRCDRKKHAGIASKFEWLDAQSSTLLGCDNYIYRASVLGGVMGRHGGILMAIARDVARAQKQAEAARLRAAREQDRHHRARLRDIARDERENLRSLKEQAREEKLQYLDVRQEEAVSLVAEASNALEEIRGVLGYSLLVNDRIDFDDLRISETIEPFTASQSLRSPDVRRTEAGFLVNAKIPTGWRKLLPGAEKRRLRALADAKLQFAQVDAEWQRRESERIERYEAEKCRYQEQVAAFAAKKHARNAEVDAFKGDYEAGDPTAIVSYCTMVMERSRYPESPSRNS